ncbi:type II toxin-antitoxin system prevent-host-death family antitoxin [Planctomonas sp. JC2975]|uniref:type II toxin-antitoxin system Phd/YefM family antitoxin n=1 Tax=Planctomonas sp. JC2975 TaxID=2729626 RepID=UPI001473D8B1|nr:type II toxin-antitoxin system prevent-host-death family antitoxin [Planctomonas sp. JC2975]NNC12905.1 type II toxin-antitoxin system prevent-host-death family antitoxin [Planctomonas sp. JC2975]
MAALHSQPINIYDAKSQFSKLVAAAENGAEITISRNGRPVVQLVPYPGPAKARKPGVWHDQVTIADDFDDFTTADEHDWYQS